MGFGVENCTMLVRKRGKQHVIEEIKLPNPEKIRTLGEKETYKYLGTLETDTIDRRKKILN